MGVSRFVRLMIVVAVVWPVLAPDILSAQETDSTVVASGLTSPRGFIWTANDTILLAMAGSGGATGAVASIDAAGCPVLLAGGLPSSLDSAGNPIGAQDLAVLESQLYVVVGEPDETGGVYIVYGDGSTALVADLSAWSQENPVGGMPNERSPVGLGSAMVADPDAGLLWVSDPGNGQLLTVTADGQINRVADFSLEPFAPTRLVLNPNGGVYVGTLSADASGTASVLSIDVDGAMSVVWTGLTAVADVEVGPEGELYALEVLTGDTSESPQMATDSGRIVRQDGASGSEIVAEGLAYPVVLGIGPDEALYLAESPTGAVNGEGAIRRIALDGSPPPTVMSAACAPLPETLGGIREPVVDAPTVSVPTVEPSSTPGTALTNEVQVAMLDSSFRPAIIEIPAGTTVRWTNLDSVEHTATGTFGEFDTGLIVPGATGSTTFDVPGTYVYYSQYHPNMQATIVVN